MCRNQRLPAFVTDERRAVQRWLASYECEQRKEAADALAGHYRAAGDEENLARIRAVISAMEAA